MMILLHNFSAPLDDTSSEMIGNYDTLLQKTKIPGAFRAIIRLKNYIKQIHH